MKLITKLCPITISNMAVREPRCFSMELDGIEDAIQLAEKMHAIRDISNHTPVKDYLHTAAATAIERTLIHELAKDPNPGPFTFMPVRPYAYGANHMNHILEDAVKPLDYAATAQLGARALTNFSGLYSQIDAGEDSTGRETNLSTELYLLEDKYEPATVTVENPMEKYRWTSPYDI